VTVVGLVAEGEDPWALPPAWEIEQRWITGGVRELYLLLAAAAAAGERAELRGPVVRAELDRICADAGVAVDLPGAARMPADDDVVLVLAGHQDPRFFARRMLSPARTAILVLAATGLFGWPFAAGWTSRDPLDADPDEVGRPEHLAAMADLGFAVWTNNPRVVADAATVGVRAVDVHSGSPRPLPPVPAKAVDVAAVTDNRWWPLTAQALDALGPGVTVDRVEAVDNDELRRRLGAARVFVHMAAIEGHSTLGEEARSLGTVPVGLRSNRFGVGFREDEGGLAVATPQDAGPAIRALLGDPARLARIAAAGRARAQADLAWAPCVERMRAALAGLADDPGRAARGEIGRLLADERLGLLGLVNEARAQAAAEEGRTAG